MTPSERLIAAIHAEESWHHEARKQIVQGDYNAVARAIVATAERCGVKPLRVMRAVGKAKAEGK